MAQGILTRWHNIYEARFVRARKISYRLRRLFILTVLTFRNFALDRRACTSHTRRLTLMLQALVNANRYDDKHLMSNEVMDKTQSPLKAMYNMQSPSRNTDCPLSSKPAMANRLLDWFSVVMADSKHRRQHPKPKGRREPV